MTTFRDVRLFSENCLGMASTSSRSIVDQKQMTGAALTSIPRSNPVDPSRDPTKNMESLTCSRDDLDRWNVLKCFDEQIKCKIKSFCVFRACGGTGAIVITADEEAFGVCTDGHCGPSLFGIVTEDGNLPCNVPFHISSLCRKNLTDVSIGVIVGAALDSLGGLYWWGNTEADRSKPQLPQRPKMPNPSPAFVKVCCGHGFMAALSAHGRVYLWGRVIYSSFVYEELITNSPVKSISCGAVHVAMLCENGTVFTWGSGLDGQRGYRSSAEKDTYLVKKLELNEPCESVACGPVSTVMLTSSGSVYACGDNSPSMGWLGVASDKTKIYTPKAVQLSSKVVFIAAAWPSPPPYVLYMAVTSDNKLYTWGISRPRLASENELVGNNLLLSAFYNTSTPRHTAVGVEIQAPLEKSISGQFLVKADQSKPIAEVAPVPIDQFLSSSIEVLSVSASNSSIKSGPDLLNHTSCGRTGSIVQTEAKTINRTAASMVEYGAKLFGNPMLSDIKFLLGDSTSFPGHRLYLCSRSKRFQHILDLDVPARDDPSMDARIYDAVAFKGLLQFLYTGNHAVSELTKLLELHALAIDFDEPALSKETANDILDLLEPGNVVQVITRARNIPSLLLMSKCETYITFLNVAKPTEMAKLFIDLTMGSPR